MRFVKSKGFICWWKSSSHSCNFPFGYTSSFRDSVHTASNTPSACLSQLSSLQIHWTALCWSTPPVVAVWNIVQLKAYQRKTLLATKSSCCPQISLHATCALQSETLVRSTKLELLYALLSNVRQHGPWTPVYTNLQQCTAMCGNVHQPLAMCGNV